MLASGRRIDLGERREHSLLVGGRDADAGVDDGESQIGDFRRFRFAIRLGRTSIVTVPAR